jgi:hypothetical protein
MGIVFAIFEEPVVEPVAVCLWAAFDLFNEPRCPASQAWGEGCAAKVTLWVNAMAKYAKKIDTNHMVSILPWLGRAMMF